MSIIKATWVNVNGDWKEIKNVWINMNGIWKEQVMPKGYVNDIWKEFMEYYKELTFIVFNEQRSDGFYNKVPIIVIDKNGNTMQSTTKKIFLDYQIRKNEHEQNILINERMGSTFIYNYKKDKLIELDNPYNIVDSKGNYIYVTNSYGHLMLQKFNSEYKKMWEKEIGETNTNKLNIVIDKNDNIFLNSRDANVYKYSPTGEQLYKQYTKIDIPFIITDGESFWYNALYGDNMLIYKLDQNGRITTFGDIKRPYCMDIDNEGNKYIYEYYDKSYIYKYDKSMKNLIWKKEFNNNNKGGKLQISKKNAIYTFKEETNSLCKYDLNLNLIWEKTVIDTSKKIKDYELLSY